ncbi:MAG: multicopy suppressor of ts gsp1 [Phylliscum demangeonii]|nr:MAG: multicopy suppressor of ts gsp1 [Phylliscum demangeonii]
MADFQPVALFGGAITVQLPASFTDASALRQVPDSQEVYLARTGFSSVVFDLTERVEAGGGGDGANANDNDNDNPSADPDAAAFDAHMADLIDDADRREGRYTLWRTTRATAPNVAPETPVLTRLVTVKHDAAGQRNDRGRLTAILLILIRLERVKTDVLVSINVPHHDRGVDEVEDEWEGDPANGVRGAWLRPEMQMAAAMQDEILRSFTVVDWRLFDGGGALG